MCILVTGTGAAAKFAVVWEGGLPSCGKVAYYRVGRWLTIVWEGGLPSCGKVVALPKRPPGKLCFAGSTRYDFSYTKHSQAVIIGYDMYSTAL